jgi:hypothetical protein
MRIIRILPFLVLFAATAIAQEAKPIVEATGALDRVLDDKGSVDLYIKLADAAAPAPVMTEVTRDGVAVSITLFTVEYVKTPTQPRLHIAASDLAKLEPGTYSIGIEIAPPASPEGGKSPYKASNLVVKVKHSVPAAEKATLAVDTLRAERVAYVPGLFSWWRPARWTLQESSGKNGVTFDKGKWSVTLKNAETNPDVRTLRVAVAELDENEQTTELTVGPGQTAELVAEPVEWSYPLGKMTGTFKLQAAELAAPVDVNVEVLTRWSRWLLLLLLIASIFLGWFTRTWLEGRRLVASARIAANQELEREKEILLSVRDPEYVARIGKIIVGLKAGIGKDDAKSVIEATATANQAVTAAVDEMSTKEKEARDFLTKVYDAVFGGELQTGEMQEFARTKIDEVSAIDAKLEKGVIGASRKEAETLAAAVPKDAQPVIYLWRETMRVLFDEIEKWPETNLGDLTLWRAKLETMKAGDLTAVKSAFADAGEMNGFFKARLGRTVVPQIRGIASYVEQGLSAFGIPALQSKAEALRSAAESIPADREHILDDPAVLSDALATLHGAIVNALTAAVPDGKPKPAEIDQNRFLAALDAIRMLVIPDKMSTDEAPAAFAVEKFTAPEGEVLPRAAPLFVTIEQSGVAVVGEALTLTASVRLGGEPHTQVTVRWTVGEMTYLGEVGELTFSFVPQASVPVVVAVHVISALDGRSADATKRIVPLPQELFDIAYQQAQEKRAKDLQTAIAGVLIVLAGLLIFKDWIGTLPDLLGAVFWGFAADISVATVMSYADPLKLKKPFP